MRSYLKYKIFCAGWLAFLFVMGYATLLRPPSYEIFPFYSWTMFALTPQLERDYSIVFVEHDGKVLAEPLDFKLAGDYAISNDSIVAYQLIQKLGEAYEAGRKHDVQEMRERLESRYFRGPSRYRLRKITFDPLIKWKTGQETNEDLAEWTSGSTPP